MVYAAAVLMLAFGTRYFLTKDNGSKKPLIFKALATLMPVLLSLFYAISTDEISAWWIFAGILCYMAADVLLEIWFLTGVAAFGIGHICVITGFIQRGILSGYVGIFFVIFYGFMFIAVQHYLGQLDKLLVPGFLYAGLLCLMAAFAVTGGITMHHPGEVFMGIGGVCFVISDTILGWCYLSGNRSRRNSAVLLVLYYMAVYLLAAGQYY